MNGKYKIENGNENVISEHYFESAEEAVREAYNMWSRMSKYDLETDKVVAYRVEMENIDGEEYENLYEIWSSDVEGKALMKCKNATSAMMYTIRNGKETTLTWGEGSGESMPDLERILELARAEASEHPGKVCVEFFEDLEDGEGNFEFVSLGLYEGF